MSRAFVKEDVDVPERSVRARSASGLPPGTLNYITAHGVQQLREKLAALRNASGNENAAQIEELEQILDSVTIVETPGSPPETATFGTAVTVRNADGDLRTYRIAGVDEVELSEDTVSWISETGKALLGTEIGDRVSLDPETKKTAEIVKISTLDSPAGLAPRPGPD